jgi:Holliday junction resolvasome RuvABC endonuclease subunit
MSKRQRKIKSKNLYEETLSQTKILAIDPASILGWAVSESEYGTWDLRTRKDESMGMKLLRLRAKLEEVLMLTGFNVLVYEQPGGRHTGAIIHQSKLIGKIEEFCAERGIEFRAYSASAIKKFATGKGNAGKPDMITAAKEKYKYVGEDDNEADALHLLHLAKFELGIKN